MVQRSTVCKRYAQFAGSVFIGFAMLDELRRLCDFGDPDMAANPAALAQQWPHHARRIFQATSARDRQMQCHLMLIMVDPQDHGGNRAWPRSCVQIYKSPDFIAEEIQSHRFGSIGSGSAYSPCKAAIESFGDHRRTDIFLQGEVGTSGGMGSMLGYDLTRVLKDVQPRGISAHLHYCWVYQGQTIIRTNDHAEKGRWTIAEHGSGINQGPGHFNEVASRQAALEDGSELFEMPRLAQSWDELMRILDGMAKNAQGCTA